MSRVALKTATISVPQKPRTEMPSMLAGKPPMKAPAA